MKFKIRKPQLKIKGPKFSSEGIKSLFIRIVSSTIPQFLALAAVLVGLNVVSQRYFYRIDITQNKVYTLSEATKKTLSELDEPVTINLFFSDNIPPDIVSVPKEAQDLYAEFQRFSSDKVRVEVKDPSNNDDDYNEAIEAGLQELQYSSFGGDKYEVARGFLGIGVYYKDKKEPIDVVTETTKLEYDTTLLLRKMTRESFPKIGFLTGHGEKSTSLDYTEMKTALEREYEVVDVSLENGTPIDESIEVLVIANPQDDFSNRDKFEIDQFLMKGKKVVVLADPHQVNLQTMLGTKTENNFKEFIEHYGITWEDGIVMDESFQPVLVNGIFPFDYYYWVKALNENFDQDNPAIADLETVTFNWATNLKKKEDKEGREVKSLIKTTEDAGIFLGDTVPVGLEQAVTFVNRGQKNLVMQVSGKQESLFKDKKVPKVKEDKRENFDKIETTDNLNLIVIGDADLISDSFVGYNEGSGNFFLNLMEWYSGEGDLIAMRSRMNTDRPLENISDGNKTFTKGINIGLVPVLVILLGFGYNLWRGSRGSLI